jgi:hypothetical protein
VLTNVAQSGENQRSTSRPATPSGSAAAGASTTSEQRIALAGSPAGFDMEKNLNHRVQITGNYMSASASGSTSASNPSASAAAGGQSSAANPSASASAGGNNAGASASAGQSAGSAAGQSRASSLDSAVRTVMVTTAKEMSDRCTTN